MDININKGKVLYNMLNEYFKDNIRISYKTSEKLIVITKEDLFYCIDLKSELIPSFIIKNDDSIIESMILNEMCYKNIVHLVYSGNCFVAKNNYDKVYFCKEKYGFEMEFKEFITHEEIIDIDCAPNHLLILTQNGKVFEYEHIDQLNLMENSNSNLKKLNFPKKERICMISCGSKHSLALTEEGNVFGWGSNNNGQLGVDKIEKSHVPISIGLDQEKIKKICCGEFHSLLLTYSGNIYEFRCNIFEEPGVEIKKYRKNAINLKEDIKFIDIAAHADYGISVSLSIYGTYYVWGQHGKGNIFTPKETKFKSFNDIFNDYFEINYNPSERIIEFDDKFFRYGYYLDKFEETKEIGKGTYGVVYAAKLIESNSFYAIKKIQFNSEHRYEVLKEYMNFSVIHKLTDSKNKYLASHFDAWFEEKHEKFNEEANPTLYIQMELCDANLEDIIQQIEVDTMMKIDGTLTSVGYYIASQIFIEILEGVNYLHSQMPPIIHRNLCPANVLFKYNSANCHFTKITDFGLMVIHKFSEQSHTLDQGSPKYKAPEVINNRKYDTKADIYSLGVILQTMFDLQTDGSYDENQDISNLLKSKYQNAVELFDLMLRVIPNKRPNCGQILNTKNSWALNEMELEINDDFEIALETELIGPKFSIYHMLKKRSKLINISRKS